jgi:hypothetical protein
MHIFGVHEATAINQMIGERCRQIHLWLQSPSKVILILNHLEGILEWEMWKIYWIETPSHFIISFFLLGHIESFAYLASALQPSRELIN